MNITLNGTKITQDTRNLAFEKNSGVDEIVITVDTDESWSYKLDVKYPDKYNVENDALYNIIDLDRNGIICSVILTREMLPFNGKYTMQLRGINGDKVYHSDTFEVWVKYSIEPGPTYNPVPSEFYQVEARLDDKVDEAKKYAENAKIASTRMPKISSDNTWLIWDAETGDYVDTGIVASGGTTDHSKLINRSAADQHPMSAITGLEKALESKQPAGAYLTDKDLDTTLKETGKAADAAEVGKRLSSLSEEIVTTAESKVSAHNTGTDTHSDIRLLISGLTDRLNALADSDDTTLDQLSEVVSYIKSNRDLISAITTSKVNVSDIVDNLTTNVANKPLSAAQGVALKALIDAITVPDKLPNPNALTFTGAVNGIYDGSEPITINIPSGGGGGNWKQAGFVQSETDGETLEVSGLDTKSIRLVVCAAAYASDTNSKSAVIKINGAISLNYPGFIPLTDIKVTVIEIHLITTPSGNYIFAPNFPSMRATDDTATSASHQVGNYSAWFLVRADTVEKIESISFASGNGRLLTGSKLNVEVI